MTDVIYRSSRQGGRRYEGIVDGEAQAFDWPFTEGFYLEAQAVWDALSGGTRFREASVAEIFGDKAGPLHVEIGIGNGEFLSHYAGLAPSSSWLGFEVFHKVFEKAVRRVRRLGLENVRLIQFDAELFIRLLPDVSVAGFYVNFPDPWPKARHHKRRLLKPWFIELMREKLIPGGQLSIATDHSGYAEEITANLGEVSGFKSLAGPLPANDMGDYYKTKYYRKFAAKERVYFYKLEKTDG